MRILMCNYEYPPVGGGGGVVMAWLAEELARRHEVTVLTSRIGELATQEIRNGVEIIRAPVWLRTSFQQANLPSMVSYVPSALWSARRLKDRNFQLINSHFAVPSGPVGAFLSRSWGVPHILSVHGGDLYDPSKRMSPHRHALLRATVRHLARSAESTVAQSTDTASNLRTFFTPELQAAIIPLGIPRPSVPARDRKSLGLSENAFVIASVGRLVPRKAVDRLLHVFANAGIPDSCLVIMGDGSELPSLKAMASTLGITEKVRFPGFVSDADKYRFLAAADAYVSTSLHEGFGLVFLEGAAAGLPVLCYNHGGQTDFLVDGQTGYVVEAGDEASMTKHMLELAANRRLLSKLGEGARNMAETYMIDRCAEQYERLFDQIIASRPSAPAGERISRSG
jgi:glycosyltransferase involved in cell wall biosynthesis